HDVGGFTGLVISMAVHNGSLIVGGSFTNLGGVAATNIARWDGHNWSAMGAGLGIYDSSSGISVGAVSVFQNQLYAAGNFTNSGSSLTRNIARWNGSDWEEIGGGVGGQVNGLATDASHLYVGGEFYTVGSLSASCIAAWDGANWSTLGGGVSSNVQTVAVSDGVVYAGGNFLRADT